MALIITGMNGTGTSKFAERLDHHEIAFDDLDRFHYGLKSGLKKTYHNINGPHETFANELQAMLTLMEDYYPQFYSAIHDGTLNADLKENKRPVWITGNIGFAQWMKDNKSADNHTFVLLKLDRDLHCQRLYQRESTRDPRLIGKTNAYELVKHEYIKEISWHQPRIDAFEAVADYVIENDGTLDQFATVIDTILNENNLLD